MTVLHCCHVVCVQTWAGKPENWEAAQKVLLSLAAVNSQAQLGQYKGPHPCPGGGRILQASRGFSRQVENQGCVSGDGLLCCCS
jgi:hypothetical protein